MKVIILALFLFYPFAHTVSAQSGYIEVASPNEVCHGDNVVFTIETDLSIDFIIGWDFGDPASGAANTSTLGTPTHEFSAPGSYTVNCILQVNCIDSLDLTDPIVTPCFYTDTISKNILVNDCSTTPNDGFIEIVAPAQHCVGESINFQLNTDLQIEAFLGWNFGDPESGFANSSEFGSTSHVYDRPGVYTVSCIVQVNCGGPIDLNSPIVTTCFYIDTVYKTIVITDCTAPEEKCTVYLPNTFTADANGVNETFVPVSSCIFGHYSFTVFNRWGQPVFTSANPGESWDGTQHGKKCPSGVYVVRLEYSFPQDMKKSILRHVNLLR